MVEPPFLACFNGPTFRLTGIYYIHLLAQVKALEQMRDRIRALGSTPFAQLDLRRWERVNALANRLHTRTVLGLNMPHPIPPLPPHRRQTHALWYTGWKRLPPNPKRVTFGRPIIFRPFAKAVGSVTWTIIAPSAPHAT